ncbi:MAG: PrsW family glutamic-type intramembrane protease [Anaerolineae bacterium]|nr:PrsW family glutamic-type intramembrane protease [Anaerolineae bacterium]
MLDLFGTGKLSTVLICLAWGGTGAFFLANVTENLLQAQGVAYLSVVTVAAPVVEEVYKALVLIYFIRQPRFRYIVDGAVYGFAVGIGFGVMENLFIYLPQNPNAVLVDTISRTLTAVLMHAGASALVGISLGRLRRARSAGRAVWAFAGVALAIASHYLYNNIAYRLDAGNRAQLLLLFGVGFGIGSMVVIGLLMRQGLRDEKARFADTLSLDIGVSTGERKAIQQLGGAAIQQVLDELGESFGEASLARIRRLLVVQANIGILRNNLNYPASDRLRKAWLDELGQLLAEADGIRRELGAYIYSYLRNVFPADDAQMQALLEGEFARFDPTLVHTFDMFMRVSELAETFTPEQLVAMAARLGRAVIFQHVSPTDLENLSRAIEVVRFPDGALLFDKGDRGDAMYFVESGRIDVFTKDDAGQEQLLRAFEVGDVVGEFSLLDGRPRSAPARAHGPVEALMLRREVFMMFIGSRPRVIMAMLQYLAEKAQYTTQAVEKGVAWAKKIAQGDYAPPARVEAPAPVVTPAAMPDEATGGDAGARGGCVRARRRLPPTPRAGDPQPGRRNPGRGLMRRR